MSASRESKQRRKVQEAGPNEKTLQEQKEARREKRKWKGIAAIFIIVIVLFVAMVVWQSNVIQKNMEAVTVADEKFVAADVSYYYNSAYNQMANEYGDIWGYVVDSSKPLSQQPYDDTRSWHDFFVENGVNLLQQTVILSNLAEEAGYTMSEETKAHRWLRRASHRRRCPAAGCRRPAR